MIKIKKHLFTQHADQRVAAPGLKEDAFVMIILQC